MNAFRLEEVLRLLLIAAIASAIGTMGEFVATTEHLGKDTFGLALIFLFVAWPIGAGITFVAGFFIHLMLRSHHVSCWAILPVFVVAAAAIAWAIFYPNWQQHYQLIALGTSVISWVLYCFGPLPLWRYQFDPSTDSDF